MLAVCFFILLAFVAALAYVVLRMSSSKNEVPLHDDADAGDDCECEYVCDSDCEMDFEEDDEEFEDDEKFYCTPSQTVEELFDRYIKEHKDLIMFVKQKKLFYLLNGLYIPYKLRNLAVYQCILDEFMEHPKYPDLAQPIRDRCARLRTILEEIIAIENARPP